MKRRMITALAVGATLGISAPASASIVLFSGTATGCFGTACTPGPYVAPPGAGSSVTNDGLMYVNGQFNQSTDPSGLLGLGGSQDNLGPMRFRDHGAQQGDRSQNNGGGGGRRRRGGKKNR